MPENSPKYRWGWLAAALAAGLLLCNTAFASLAQAAGPQPAQARAAAAGLTLTARVGFDGYYKDGQWTPIRVTIANDGPDVKGTLQVKVPHNNAEMLYTRPVDMPTQSRREFFFYVPAEGYFNSPFKIDLVAGNKILASTSTRVIQATASDYIYGVIAHSPSAFNTLADIDPINGQGYVAQLDLADLPPLAASWKALDLLVISDVDTGVFSPEQRQALEDWVQQGGRLVVVGGAGWEKTSAGLGPLVPLSASGTQSVADLRALGNYAGAIAPAGPALATVGQLPSDAITLVQTEEVPALIYRHLGFGLVAFMAFDPALAPLKGWDGIAGLFRGLLAIPLDRPNWANGFFNWSSANDAARAVPGLAVPSVWQVCGFLGVYILVVGPLNFLILWRLKRRSWAWVTIPGLVLLFSVAAYLTGYGLRGNQAILHRLAIVQVWPNAERAQAEQIVGIFSPQRTTYEVSFDPGTLARPVPYSGGLPSLASVMVEQSDHFRLPAIHTEIGAVETYIAQGQVPAPRLEASLTLSLPDADGSGLASLQGTLTNRSDLTLSNAVLLAPGSAQTLGDIQPGQTVKVSGLSLATTGRATPAKGSTISPSPFSPIGKLPPSYYGSDNTFSDILGTVYPTNQEQYRRNALLSSALDQYGSGMRGNGVYLTGWTATSPLGAKVSVPFHTLDMSLYLITLPYTLDAGQPSISLPPGLLTWTPLDLNQNNYSPYDTYLDPSSEMGFEFVPGLPAPITSLRALTLHLLGNGLIGPVTNVHVQLYDFTENTWVDQPNVVWGDTPITAPARYLGPNHNVLVRIKNTSGMSLNIVQADFTLEVEQ